MALVVNVLDGVNARPRQAVMQLRLGAERVSARELIERRVRQEVSEYNSRPLEYFRTIIHPTEAEETLNGYRLRSPRPISVEIQIAHALETFRSNDFFLLADNHQLTDLDEMVTLTPRSTVTFLKLVRLTGGSADARVKHR
jgi:hypothetical protein